MKGKLRALGLALLAAFAISAVVASAAQATAKFTTVNNDYPVVVTGAQEVAETPEQTKNTTYVEATPGNRLHCEVIEFEGTATAATTATTVTPHFTGCESTGAVNVGSTTHLNGCHFIFEALANTTETDTHGRAKIVCPAGGKITITAGTCQVHLYPQTIGGGAGEITFTNIKGSAGKTPHDYITVDVDITNKIHYEDTDGFLCPFSGNSTGTNGTLVAVVILKAYADNGNSGDPKTPGLLDYTHPATETSIHVK